MTTPDEHLKIAAGLLDVATEHMGEHGDAEALTALGTLALAHATVSGELMAQRADDARPTDRHECDLPTDVPGPAGQSWEVTCADCGAVWRLASVTPQHLVWVGQRVVRRQPMGGAS